MREPAMTSIWQLRVGYQRADFEYRYHDDADTLANWASANGDDIMGALDELDTLMRIVRCKLEMIHTEGVDSCRSDVEAWARDVLSALDALRDGSNG